MTPDSWRHLRRLTVFLHQDWDLETATVHDVLLGVFSPLDAETRSGLADALRTALATFPDEGSFADALYRAGAHAAPDGAHETVADFIGRWGQPSLEDEINASPGWVYVLSTINGSIDGWSARRGH
jgi:hypothetical protein